MNEQNAPFKENIARIANAVPELLSCQKLSKLSKNFKITKL